MLEAQHSQCLSYHFYVSLIYLLLPFDLIFYKIIYPRTVIIIKCNQFVGNNFEKMFIIFLLDIENSLLTVMLLHVIWG